MKQDEYKITAKDVIRAWDAYKMRGYSGVRSRCDKFLSDEYFMNQLLLVTKQTA